MRQVIPSTKWRYATELGKAAALDLHRTLRSLHLAKTADTLCFSHKMDRLFHLPQWAYSIPELQTKGNSDS